MTSKCVGSLIDINHGEDSLLCEWASYYPVDIDVCKATINNRIVEHYRVSSKIRFSNFEGLKCQKIVKKMTEKETFNVWKGLFVDTL